MKYDIKEKDLIPDKSKLLGDTYIHIHRYQGKITVEYIIDGY